MSSYVNRWCEIHGEWEQDIDNPWEECPQCVAAGCSPSQREAAEKKALKSEIESLRAAIEVKDRALAIVKETCDEAFMDAGYEQHRTDPFCPLCGSSYGHSADCPYLVVTAALSSTPPSERETGNPEGNKDDCWLAAQKGGGR